MLDIPEGLAPFVATAASALVLVLARLTWNRLHDRVTKVEDKLESKADADEVDKTVSAVREEFRSLRDANTEQHSETRSGVTAIHQRLDKVLLLAASGELGGKSKFGGGK